MSMLVLRQLPNAITVARILMVVPLVWLLREARFTEALWLALIAGASDAVDGFLAKRFSWESRIGGLLDPIADKLLLDACYLGLWGAGHMPTWIAVLVVGRDVVILLGAVAWHWLIRPLSASPSLLSKATTLAQVLLVLAWLLHLSLLPLPEAPLQAGIVLVALLTAASGIDYIVRWTVKARRERRGRTA